MKLLPGAHPADFAEGKLDLLCVTPEATGWAGLSAVNCRCSSCRGRRAPWSRGAALRQCGELRHITQGHLTFSSLEGTRSAWRSSGRSWMWTAAWWNSREFVLPFPPGLPPAGYWLRRGPAPAGRGAGKLADGTKEAK